MVFINVLCPECGGLDVMKHGKLPSGEQRYHCNDSDCKLFLIINTKDACQK